MNDNDPNFGRIEKLTSKIERRREKIKLVSEKSQVALWGKNGSYQPP